MEQAHFYRIISIWSTSTEDREQAYRTFIELLGKNWDNHQLRVFGLADDKGCEYAFCARDRDSVMTKTLKDTANLFMLTQPKTTVRQHVWHRRACFGSSITLDENGIKHLDDNLYQDGTYERSETSFPKPNKPITTYDLHKSIEKTSSPSIIKSKAQSDFEILKQQAANLALVMDGMKDPPIIVSAANLNTVLDVLRDPVPSSSSFPKYYCILSIEAPYKADLEAAVDTFLDHLDPRCEKDRIRMRSMVDGGNGVVCKFDVIDLHQETVDYLKTAALLYEATLPRDTRLVCINSYWRDPVDDKIAAISRVVNYWPKPSNPTSVLGVRVDDPEISNPTTITYSDQEDQNPSSVKPSNQDIQWTDEMMNESNKQALRVMMRNEMNWKDWDWDLEREKPAMAHWCMCRWPYATYQAKPCGHAYVCDACFGDFNKHPILSQVCPKCLEPIEQTVHKLPPGPLDIPPVAKSVMDMDVLEDDDLMDIEYYNSDEWEDCDDRDADEEYDEKGTG